MPRKAGSDAEYKWVLWNKATDEAEPGVADIDLPSSTSIISAVLAKPQIPPWYYTKTLEGFVALMSCEMDEGMDDFEGMLTDYDMLNEALTLNRLRPVDIRDDAAERGTAVHSMLENLCASDDGMAHARWLTEQDDLFATAIGDWWLTRKPQVIASEKVLRSPRMGFAGTCDLVYQSPIFGSRTLGLPTACDLKTGNIGRKMYLSDDLQVGSYKLAWDEEFPDNPIAHRTVLIVREDGDWVEEPCVVPPELFLNLLTLYPFVR